MSGTRFAPMIVKNRVTTVARMTLPGAEYARFTDMVNAIGATALIAMFDLSLDTIAHGLEMDREDLVAILELID